MQSRIHTFVRTAGCSMLMAGYCAFTTWSYWGQHITFPVLPQKMLAGTLLAASWLFSLILCFRDDDCAKRTLMRLAWLSNGVAALALLTTLGELRKILRFSDSLRLQFVLWGGLLVLSVLAVIAIFSYLNDTLIKTSERSTK